MCTRVALHPHGGESFPKDCKGLWSYASRERHPTSIQTPSGSPLWSPTSREGTPPFQWVQVHTSMENPLSHYRGQSYHIAPHVTQWDMANFHHTTPTMENATVPQGPGPIQLQQAPGSYHGSQSCPSSGYPALSETHYHPSQVLTHAQ